jgi:hypothetical protein
MRTTRRFSINWVLAATAFAILGAMSIVSNPAQAQSAGNNAVYNSAGSSVIGSSAFIDASAFGNTTTKPTICAIIYGIISTSYPAAGAVIDARGLVDGTNATFTCATTESPWLSGSTYQDHPSVVLLPAGKITISYTWVLPNNTKIVGLGASTPVTSGTQTGTVITATSSFTGPASGYSPAAPVAMIQFGDPGIQTCSPGGGAGVAGVCFNISVEDLTLNNAGGATQTIDGILNLNSQELTYARRVNLYGITGTGIQVGYTNYASQAQNSGPYEQIYYSSQSSSGHCAQIYGAPTRGIHGITCVASSNTGGAILLDSGSNSIEDASISGFGDGILAGSQSSTSSRPWGNVLSDISGGGTGTNLVRLCSATNAGNCTSSTAVAVQDITILGATSTGGNTIQDDVTGTTLANTTDPTVGMYALGEQQALISGTTYGYSRFTTSPSVPSWYVGSTQSPSGSCSNGSIYSATGTSGSGTLWGCIAGGWVNVK